MEATMTTMTTDDVQVVDETVFRAHDDVAVASFFTEGPDTVPEFLGESMVDHVAVWMRLQGRENRDIWRSAAIADSIERNPGHRTDLNRDAGGSVLQRFCLAIHRDTGYVSKLSKTYHVFRSLLVTGTKKSLPALLADDSLTFKHFYVAANHTSLHVEALIEARDCGWSATQFARILAARKNRTLLDTVMEQPVEEDDDMDVSHWKGMPRVESVTSPKGTRTIKLLLTVKELAVLSKQLRELSPVLQTTSDVATLLAAVQTAHEQRVRLAGDVSSGVR
jgi:hypothetical protein